MTMLDNEKAKEVFMGLYHRNQPNLRSTISQVRTDENMSYHVRSTEDVEVVVGRRALDLFVNAGDMDAEKELVEKMTELRQESEKVKQ